VPSSDEERDLKRADKRGYDSCVKTILEWLLANHPPADDRAEEALTKQAMSHCLTKCTQ